MYDSCTYIFSAGLYLEFKIATAKSVHAWGNILLNKTLTATKLASPYNNNDVYFNEARKVNKKFRRNRGTQCNGGRGWWEDDLRTLIVGT